MKEAAIDTAVRAKERAGEVIGRRKDDLADEAEGVALALRRAADSLRDQGRAPVATYAEKTARQVERVSEALRSEDVRGLFRRVEAFAKREPALFLGGALALGFLASRFMKSGRSEE